MATFDIRHKENEKITEIKYADGEMLSYESAAHFGISDDAEEGMTIYFCDIDNLILALKKAKEIWRN